MSNSDEKEFKRVRTFHLLTEEEMNEIGRENWDFKQVFLDKDNYYVYIFQQDVFRVRSWD